MFTMKKPLLVLFFLGTVSLSVCEQERAADDDEGEVIEEEVKRDSMGAVKLAKLLIDKMKCEVTKAC
uniref:Jindongenin-1b n=1 Tax=Amolops jingdongensis TaxID=1077530 RepID=G3F826_AMOJI|nr:jindongenin-1b [Amolops sp. 'jingdongensis']